MLRKDLLPNLLYHSFILKFALCILIVSRARKVNLISINIKPLNSWAHDLLTVVKWILHFLFRTVICRSRVWEFIYSFRFKNTGLGLTAGLVHDCVHERSDSVVRKGRGEFFCWFLYFFVNIITSWSKLSSNHWFRPTEPFLLIPSPANYSFMFWTDRRANLIISRPIISDLDVVLNVDWINIFSIVWIAEQYSYFSIFFTDDWRNFPLLVPFSQLQKVFLFLLNLFLPDFWICGFRSFLLL